MESKGRDLHGKAAQTREEGFLVESLSLDNQALVEYSTENDDLGFAECLANTSITRRHQSDQLNDQKFLIIAKHEIMASIEIAENSGVKEALALPYFNLGKVLTELGADQEAVRAHKKALEYILSNPPESHNRAAIKADFAIHYHVARYRAGDKSALSDIELSLKNLQDNPDISDFNQHVWESGAHMHLAEILKVDDPSSAKLHLEEAEKIINSDERLTLRKAQLEKLKNQF